MNKLQLVTSNLASAEQISEALHWAIRFGDIVMPPEEAALISKHVGSLNFLLSFICKLYVNSVIQGDEISAGKLIKYLSRLGDPYMPDICDKAGVYQQDDAFLDSMAEDYG